MQMIIIEIRSRKVKGWTILKKQADTFTSKSSRHYLLVKISRSKLVLLLVCFDFPA